MTTKARKLPSIRDNLCLCYVRIGACMVVGGVQVISQGSRQLTGHYLRSCDQLGITWGVVTNMAPSGLYLFKDSTTVICSSEVPGGVSITR